MSWEKSMGSAAETAMARHAIPIAATRRWGEDDISSWPSEDLTGFNVVNRRVGIKTLAEAVWPQCFYDFLHEQFKRNHRHFDRWAWHAR